MSPDTYSDTYSETWGAATDPGTPPGITYAYEWVRVSTTGAKTTISGATGTSYTPVVGDVGFKMIFRVKATNQYGTTVAESAPTAAVVSAAVDPPPPPPPPPPPDGNLFVALTGDMCENNNRDADTNKIAHVATSDLILGESRIHAAVLCGDLQYSDGTINEFAAGYANSYARHDKKNILTPGNHEANSNFSGYDDWIAKHDTYVAKGTAHQPNQPTKRWYGVHLANGWTVVNLDSNVPSGSEQLTWLDNFLKNETRGKHVIAQWHHPRWNAQGTSGLSGMSQLYTILYNNRVDFLLVGHAHYYLRVRRLNPSGSPDDTKGVQELLVGTGGHGLGLSSNSNPHGQKFVYKYGVARLELTPTEAKGVFLDTKSQTLDSWTIPLLDRTL